MTAAAPLTAAELRREAVYWLLDVTWAGRVLRWATDAVTLVDENGVSIEYEAGLEISIADSFALLADEADDLDTLRFRSLIPPPGFSAALEVAEGRWLVNGTAELSQWAAGRAYEGRVVRLLGTARLIDAGGEDQPLAIAVDPPNRTDLALVPKPTEIISEAFAPDGDVGELYAYVYGRPSVDDTDASWSTQELQSLKTGGTDRWLVSAGAIEATTLHCFDEDTETTSDLTVSVRDDGAGNIQSVVNWAVNGPVGANWNHANTTGGGRTGGFGTGAIVGAGDLCIDLLSRSTVAWDIPAWQSVRAYLNQFTFSFWIDVATSPFAFLRQNIFPLLPISVRPGPRGMRPTVWRFDANTSDVVRALELDRDLIRGSRVRLQNPQVAGLPDGPLTEITLAYAPRGDDGSFYRSMTITGRPTNAVVDEVINSSVLRSSWGTFGERIGQLESRVVYTTESASQVLSWMGPAVAWPWQTVDYDASDADISTLRAGDVISITDAEYGWSSRIGLVKRIDLVPPHPSLELLLIYNGVRDARP